MVSPRSLRRSMSRFRIWAWTETSSAETATSRVVVGSSAISTSGSLIRSPSAVNKDDTVIYRSGMNTLDYDRDPDVDIDLQGCRLTPVLQPLSEFRYSWQKWVSAFTPRLQIRPVDPSRSRRPPICLPRPPEPGYAPPGSVGSSGPAPADPAAR